MRSPRLLAALALSLLLVRPGAATAQELPSFSAPVVDVARAVPDDLEPGLNAALEDYRRRTGNQVAVAVIRTTGRQSLEQYSIDLARKWGVGSEREDNGVLLLIALDDRKVRIEVGRGVEDELTDIESGRIIDQRIIPLLRNGEVGPAVEQGTGAIRQALGDTAVGALPPVPASERSDEDDGPGFNLFPVLLLGFGLMSFMGNRRRRRRWGGMGFPIIWGGGFGGGGGWGGGGFGGGGGGGGGFGGGGGGGFGGGGASGGW